MTGNRLRRHPATDDNQRLGDRYLRRLRDDGDEPSGPAVSRETVTRLPKMAAKQSRTDSFSVGVREDAAKTKGELNPIWRFFGADEPNYAYIAFAFEPATEARKRPKFLATVG